MKKIQDDVLEIYSDLVLLSPPKAEAEEIKEQEEGEKAEKAEEFDLETGVGRSKLVQSVYTAITSSLGPIVNVIAKGDPFPESRMKPAVDKALEKLEKIIDFFCF